MKKLNNNSGRSLSARCGHMETPVKVGIAAIVVIPWLIVGMLEYREYLAEVKQNGKAEAPQSAEAPQPAAEPKILLTDGWNGLESGAAGQRESPNDKGPVLGVVTATPPIDIGVGVRLYQVRTEGLGVIAAHSTKDLVANDKVKVVQEPTLDEYNEMRTLYWAERR